jgi:hypothetical protein
MSMHRGAESRFGTMRIYSAQIPKIGIWVQDVIIGLLIIFAAAVSPLPLRSERVAMECCKDRQVAFD